MDQIKFGKFLSSLRTSKNLTQEQLAEKLNIGSKTISKWECGNTIPDFATIIKISEVLDVSVYELSICERIPKQSIKQETLNKLKNIKDLKKIKLRNKILLATSIIIFIILILSFIFTIFNFNTVEVYTIKSLDDNYWIEGSFVKTKKYSFLDIIKISLISNDKQKYNIEINKFEYDIFNNDNCIYNNKVFIMDDDKKSKCNLLDEINNLSISSTIDISKINKNETFTLNIYYIDMKNENQELKFNFILSNQYSNNSLW